MMTEEKINRVVSALERTLLVKFELKQKRPKSYVFFGTSVDQRIPLVLKVIKNGRKPILSEIDNEAEIFQILSEGALAPRLVYSSSDCGLKFHVSEICQYPSLIELRSDLKDNLNTAMNFLGSALLNWVGRVHNSGVAHLDIAMDHVFLNEEGEVQLIDFEHSVFLRQSVHEIHRWPDLFSVAQILCEICTNRRYLHWSEYANLDEALEITSGLNSTNISQENVKRIEMLMQDSAEAIFGATKGELEYQSALRLFS